ncbi:photosystem II protein K [Iris pallida]|uniref:Photosystem II protein K (Chloroplast) n=1 Tax=Iris pallida TaxID=29817 RepID=A0AAX6E8B5_IRIPA|nr:photosystem II protein K [Iris pallida]
MLNFSSFISICFNFTFDLNSFFFAKLPEAYAFFQSNRRRYAYHTFIFFSLSLCLASCCKFSMKYFIFREIQYLFGKNG